MQSPEYPDLRWMPPKSWTNADRTSVQIIVIHDTEGSEGITSAEDGAAYDQRRTDGTSTHYFHDADSTVQCVRTEDQAHAARTQGNRRGIQHELCGKASQGATGWADAVSQGTIEQAAKQTARDCKKWGIPIRKLTPAQVAAGVKGICGHADVTAAFPQDNGTHTDPGPTFPWPAFLELVKTFTNGDQVSMTTREDAKQGIADAFAEAAATTDDTTANDTVWGRQFRKSLDTVFDFTGAAGPLADAVNVIAVQQKVLQASVSTLQASMDALLAAHGGASDGALTPDDVQQAVKQALREGTATP